MVGCELSPDVADVAAAQASRDQSCLHTCTLTGQSVTKSTIQLLLARSMLPDSISRLWNIHVMG